MRRKMFYKNKSICSFFWDMQSFKFQKSKLKNLEVVCQNSGCSWQSCFLRDKEARKTLKDEGSISNYIKKIKTTIFYVKGAHEFSDETG